MPLQRCSVGGRKGWRWGERGKCYPGQSGKRRAIRQALAIGGGTMPTNAAKSFSGGAAGGGRRVKGSIDPSRTAGIRRTLQARIDGAFNRVRAELTRLITADRVLETDLGELTALIDRVLQSAVLGRVGDWADGVVEAYMKGAARSYAEVNRLGLRTTEAGRARGDGGTEEFLRTLMAEPLPRPQPPRTRTTSPPRRVGGVRGGKSGGGYLPPGRPTGGVFSVNAARITTQPRDVQGRFIGERARALAARLEIEMKGVTTKASQEIARVIIDGVQRGHKPSTIAREITRRVDIAKGRARAVARTEVVRAQAEGQLDALERLGAREVGLVVEVHVLGDACPLCKDREGKQFPIEQAHGVVPIHVNCRCSWEYRQAKADLRAAKTDRRKKENA